MDKTVTIVLNEAVLEGIAKLKGYLSIDPETGDPNEKTKEKFFAEHITSYLEKLYKLHTDTQIQRTQDTERTQQVKNTMEAVNIQCTIV